MIKKQLNNNWFISSHEKPLGKETVNQKVNQIEGTIQQQAEELLEMVREKPLTSILIAGGIGFILAKILNK
ncbi:DUF883 C-terminal domain-containing protein [Legionella sp. km772]|uniref:DUF883 C-terminal domain-containing protein n=1 Tax=Legionella sp. km772 TaxID=2498111 RepID=UPI000F8F50FA|nr:DUF883 C-terminal domain-containing protein [Legionella sp. km772]RUR09070.1 hypothetical protein ELY15_09730 [Legionella sp. km772]